MKKTYINPTTDIMKIQTVQMIAASRDAVTFGQDGESGTAGLNDGTASGGAFSRNGGSLWDDDEE